MDIFLVTQYLLLAGFSIAAMIYFRPKKRYREIHVISFGLLLVIASISLGFFFERNIPEMLLLIDTWGPGRGIALGYAVIIGSSSRIVCNFFNKTPQTSL